jgi:hypothetical protein
MAAEPHQPYPLSPGGNPLTRFVNLWQTPEERRGKYHLLRSIGLDVSRAQQGRDFRLSTIERLYAAELGLSGVTLPPHKSRGNNNGG